MMMMLPTQIRSSYQHRGYLLAGIVSLFLSFLPCSVPAADLTLGRLSFWVPSERMAEFETVYTEKIDPILERHGFVPSLVQGRPTEEAVFSRLFEFKTPSAVQEKRQKLREDPEYREVLHDILASYMSILPVDSTEVPQKMPEDLPSWYPTSLDKDQFFTLRDSLATLLPRMAASLSALLSADIRVKTAYIDYPIYGDVIASLENPSCSYIMEMALLGDPILVNLPWSIVNPFIHQGKSTEDSPAYQPRILSPRERSVMQQVGNQLAIDLEATWSKIVDTRVLNVQLANHPERIGLSHPSSKGILFIYQIDLPNKSGQISIFYPDTALLPLLGTFRWSLHVYSAPATPGTKTNAGPGKVVPARSGKGHWQTYGVADGLANPAVSAVFQDRDGYLWLGTTEGMSRFNGIEFENFTTEDGLVGDVISSIYQDRDGYLWFGTAAGAGRFDGKVFTNFTTRDGLPHDEIRSIYQDRDGYLWFGTAAGAGRFDGKVFTSFTTRDGLPDNRIWTIYQDSKGTLWFGTRGETARFDGKKFSPLISENGPGQNVQAIYQDEEGYLWFAPYGGGVRRYDGDTWTTFTRDDGLTSEYVLSIFQDEEGHLWFGTHGGGVSRYAGDTWTTFDGFSSVWQDRDANLWFIDFRQKSELTRYDGRKWTTFSEKDGLPSGRVNSIYQDRKGDFWFSTNGGVSRYDGRIFTTFSHKDGLGARGAISVCEDGNGHIWVNIGFGLSRYDGNTWTTFTGEDDVFSSSNSLFCDPQGDPWLLPWNLSPPFRFDGEKFTPHDRFGQNPEATGYLDPQGKLRFKSFEITAQDGVPLPIFSSIQDRKALFQSRRPDCQDRKDHFWFQTARGVGRYDGKVYQTLTSRDGLPDDSVFFIFPDSEGNVWFGSWSDRPEVVRFSQPNPVPPRVFVDAVVADQRYEEVADLALPSSEDMVGFEFHGMSMKTTPGSMVYRYRLTGYEDAWQNTRSTHVEYHDLPAGAYTFEVLAVDRDLNYSEEPATVSVEIFYQPVSSSIRLSELNVQDIFASFYKSYAQQSIGSVLVANDDPNPVEATLGFYIPDRMRRPTEQKILLEPHSSQRVPLYAILDKEILDLKGASPAQAAVSLSCTVGEQTISIEESHSITVHGRGALTWDSLGRAAAFITPEDHNVSLFARSLFETYRPRLTGRRIDGNIPTAMLLFEALNAHGIQYARDASNPYSQVRDNRAAVDHIKYPVELLHSKLGDCDDLTVLYCALLENLDIPTALVDAPDHIFMIFDSGVTEDHYFGFSLEEDRYIERDGRFWIPVEVTKLGEGSFLEAWELGARICKRLQAAGNLQITDVRQVWSEFPYALLSQTEQIELPDVDILEKAFQTDQQALRELREDYVEQQYILPLLDNPQNHSRRMDLARMRIESREYNQAISTLLPLLDTEQGSEALYLIGYAHAGKQEYERALTYFEQALTRAPNNVHYARSVETLKSTLEK